MTNRYGAVFNHHALKKKRSGPRFHEILKFMHSAFSLVCDHLEELTSYPYYSRPCVKEIMSNAVEALS